MSMAVIASPSSEGHTSVIGCTTVVCCRKQRDEMTLCKALEAVHHALMCTHYHLQPIVLQDKFDLVSSFKSMPAVRPLEPTPHKQQWHQAMSASSVTANVQGSHQFHDNLLDQRHKAAMSNLGNTESMPCTMYYRRVVSAWRGLQMSGLQEATLGLPHVRCKPCRSP